MIVFDGGVRHHKKTFGGFVRLRRTPPRMVAVINKYLWIGFLIWVIVEV